VDWVHLAEDRDRYHGPVNTLMKLPDGLSAGCSDELFSQLPRLQLRSCFHGDDVHFKAEMSRQTDPCTEPTTRRQTHAADVPSCLTAGISRLTTDAQVFKYVWHNRNNGCYPVFPSIYIISKNGCLVGWLIGYFVIICVVKGF
jgi:hypothetical protein